MVYICSFASGYLMGCECSFTDMCQRAPSVLHALCQGRQPMQTSLTEQSVCAGELPGRVLC